MGPRRNSVFDQLRRLPRRTDEQLPSSTSRSTLARGGSRHRRSDGGSISATGRVLRVSCAGGSMEAAAYFQDLLKGVKLK